MIRFTIERGRPGTPMPAWGVEYGGPMTEQMVTDVIAYLKAEFPGQLGAARGARRCMRQPRFVGQPGCRSGKEIFEARCAVCHGPEGQGKEDDASGTRGWLCGRATSRTSTRICT